MDWAVTETVLKSLEQMVAKEAQVLTEAQMQALETMPHED